MLNKYSELYLDGNELQSQGVIDLLHILVQQAVKDEADRQEEERIKAIEAIQAAQLGLSILTTHLLDSYDSTSCKCHGTTL